MAEFKQIGTVEILIDRVYPLDPQSHDIVSTDVVVEAGTYPLYSDGYTHVWIMDGVLNGNFMRRGDGLFIGGGSDIKTGIPVRFPGPFFGPNEWSGLLDSGITREGDPEQRLRITVDE